MAIRSSTFGNVRLSGDDARKFERQVKYGRQDPQVTENTKEGIRLSKEFESSGRVILSPRDR